MKIYQRASHQVLLGALSTVACLTLLSASVATAQMPQPVEPTSTAEQAVNAHILRDTYKATGDTTIGIAVFEVTGKANIAHPALAFPGPQKLIERAVSGSLISHATSVVGILAANTSRGAYTGGIARGHKIYLYTRSGSDMRGYFDQYYLERGPGRPQWKISNHSYGSTAVAGWRLEEQPEPNPPVWIWYGGAGTPEKYGMDKGDPKFGWYSPAACDLDTFITKHPDQIVVFSVGNHMGEGPDPGGPGFYVRRNAAGINKKYLLTDSVPAKNGGANGFDCIEGIKTAKNAITVGSVTRVLNDTGWTRTKFSSTGPVDDGRIKPDVMAYGGKGLNVLKNSGNAADSGTSYAAPAVTGVLAQLAQIWKRTDATPMLAATARVILCHTARDLGKVGPDYSYGWGLVDGSAAGALLVRRSTDGKFALQERAFANGQIDTLYIKAAAKAKVKVTIAWTDPQSTPVPVDANGIPPLDTNEPMLRNDLDLRVYPISGAFDQTVGVPVRPWKLSVADPGAAATRGDNTVDNIEQVSLIASSPLTTTERGVYMIVIKHKGTLRLANGVASANAVQPYSLAISGGVEYFPAPRSVAAVQNGGNNERVTWRSVAGASGYEARYRQVGTLAWQTRGGIAGTTVDFNNLATGSWQLQVMATRGATKGTWSDAVVFFVGVPPLVTGMYTTNVTTSSAQLHWNAIPGVTYYDVAYAVANHEGTIVSPKFIYKTTESNKLTITNLPSDEFVVWFVNANVGTTSESGFAEAEDLLYIPQNCSSYEPSNNTVDGARVIRVNENFVGLICSSDPVDYYRIDPRDNAADRYLRIYMYAHSYPYEFRLWNRVKGIAGTLSPVPNVVKTLSPTDDRTVVYNNLDFDSYDYFIVVKSSLPGQIYSEDEFYSFWAETRNDKPWEAERDGDDDPAMSMQGGAGSAGGAGAVTAGLRR